MKKILLAIGAAAVLLATASAHNHQVATAQIGERAPAFVLRDSNGRTVTLNQFRGRYVVFEWWNYQCPYVVRHYQGNMQQLQRQMREHRVVWLTICSSAPGLEGYVSADRANQVMRQVGGSPSHILLDPTGRVGRLYNARTTPQMVLICPRGTVIYNGAIDNNPDGRQTNVINYLMQAFNEHRAGRPVSVSTTRPYGCTVKYAN